MGRTKQSFAYGLEQLYEDQDPDFVRDAIASLICWLDPRDELCPPRLRLGKGKALSTPSPDQILRESSILKMRAMRLRSLGSKDEQWEATASFHEAARKELLALEALEDASPEEIAGAQIEACGLFLEGHDPVSAAEAWARLPAWTFASESGAAMLERLEPEYKKKGQAFVEAWQSFVNSLPSPHGFERTTEQSIRTLLGKRAEPFDRVSLVQKEGWSCHALLRRGLGSFALWRGGFELHQRQDVCSA